MMHYLRGYLYLVKLSCEVEKSLRQIGVSIGRYLGSLFDIPIVELLLL